MSVGKVTVSIEVEVLKQLDWLVSERVFSNRSQAVQFAVKEEIARLNKTRLARAYKMLDPAEEQAFAEIGVHEDLSKWPEYWGTLSTTRLGRKIGKATRDDLELIVEGLNEIIDG